MHDFYSFLTGPALWLTFFIFIGGLILRVVFLYGLSKERDRVFYNHVSLKWASRSIIHWLIPWGSASMRSQPVFSFVFFIFHVCLLAVPLFLAAHNMLWKEAFGISLWSMPDGLADTMSLIVIGAVVFLFVRRLIRPEVRIMTTLWDYFLLLLTLAPFLSGFLAYHQVGGSYETMLTLHVLFAEVLLIVIPFSKLGHVILFFFSRAFIGFEMGGRREARSW